MTHPSERTEGKRETDLIKCPICGDDDFDMLGMALHFRDCERVMELRDAYRESERKKRAERLKGFKI